MLRVLPRFRRRSVRDSVGELGMVSVMSARSWFAFVRDRLASGALGSPPAEPGRDNSDSVLKPHTSWPTEGLDASCDGRGESLSEKELPAPALRRWVPVIDTDRCIGCERCLAACPHDCLEMEWSFSKLARPQDCTGEGHCVQACPEQIMRMEWVTIEEDVTAAARGG